MKTFCSLIFAMIFVFASSCSTGDEPNPVKEETLQDPEVGSEAPANSTSTSMGTFTSFTHNLSGKAFLYADGQGRRVLRFEDFTMTPGPDVYVLFSKTNNYSEANTIKISMLKKGYTDENLNFAVDNAIDLETYKFVLVYCIQYSSLFGYSEMKK